MIELKNIFKSFNQEEIISDISLFIGQGQKFVFLGKSGSGKTTLLKMINRLTSPDSGNIFFKDSDIRLLDAPVFRRNIGYVIQGISLFPHLTIAENISFVPRLLHWPAHKIENRVHDLLLKLRLPIDLLKRYPGKLSGGQQQRIGVARALAAEPAVILMDEPFGALDQSTKKEIREELKNMEDFANTTMVLVTHDIEEAIDLGEIICFIEAGKIEAQLTVDELLFTKAGEKIRKKYLKDEILLLQLKKTKFLSLLPFLNAASADGNKETILLQTETTVSQVLEKMLFQPDTPKKMIFEKKPELHITANRTEILDGFFAKINSMAN